MKRIFFAISLALLSLSAMAQVSTGNLTATAASCGSSNTTGCVVLPLASNYGSATVGISGTFSATLQFEVTNDQVNYKNVSCSTVPAGTGNSSTTTTGIWTCPASGMTFLQVRVSAFTSGTAVATINGSNTSVFQVQSQLPSGLTYSGSTLTVSSAGNGNGAIALSGNTSGTASFTAPAVAGTATNPIASTNSLNLPSGTVYEINADSGVSRIAAGVEAFGNGTAGDSSGTILADGNKVVLTADWTMGTGGTVTSAGPNIIGSGGGVPMTFTLPLATKSYRLECNGVVGQATAATANTWSLLTATNGATNVTAHYIMGTAATAMAVGAVTDQTATTTAFAIAPTWTLGGTATKMPFHIEASIEGASVSGTVLSLELTSGAVADLITIYRGSECHIQ